jgi:hypothetical protein
VILFALSFLWMVFTLAFFLKNLQGFGYFISLDFPMLILKKVYPSKQNNLKKKII